MCVYTICMVPSLFQAVFLHYSATATTTTTTTTTTTNALVKHMSALDFSGKELPGCETNIPAYTTGWYASYVTRVIIRTTATAWQNGLNKIAWQWQVLQTSQTWERDGHETENQEQPNQKHTVNKETETIITNSNNQSAWHIGNLKLSCIHQENCGWYSLQHHWWDKEATSTSDKQQKQTNTNTRTGWSDVAGSDETAKICTSRLHWARQEAENLTNNRTKNKHRTTTLKTSMLTASKTNTHKQ